MKNKKNIIDEDVNKFAYLKWLQQDCEKPFNKVLTESYVTAYISLIAQKLLDDGKCPDYRLGCVTARTFLASMILPFRENILEWVNDEPLTDIEYRGWTISAIMQARNCDFYEAATVMSAFIESGDKSSDDFPILYRTEPMYY